METQAIGRILAEARRDGRKLTEYPGETPGDLPQAFAVQDAMSAAMGKPVVGWKVGLTSAKAQTLCGHDAPLAGPVFDGDLHDSGAELSLVQDDMGVLEAEIGFRMAADLPSRAAPYERDEVVAAIGTALPVIEWVNKRLPGGLQEAAEWIVADGVINRALICGPETPFDPAMDMTTERVEVSMNGEVVTQGVGANALGDPVAVMVWLANDLSARGKRLLRGDVVATGLICDVVRAEPKVTVDVRFAALGNVSVKVA